MIKLYISTDIAAFDLQEALGKISQERREKALKFRFERGQRECVLAYILLKQGLRELYGINENPRLTEEPHGKPLLKDYPHIHFNLSHCREAVACAVGDEPVGVDVEYIRPYKEPLARHVLNEEELQDVLTSGDAARRFTELWTQKEALLKLTGHGIREDLKTVLPHNGVMFQSQSSDKYVCTIATYQ